MTSEKLMEVVGYVLADAALAASEAGEGRAFEPFGGIVRDGKFQMADFGTDSEDQRDAGVQALDYLTAHADEYTAWVLAVDTILLNLGNVERLKEMDPSQLDFSALERDDCIQITAWEQGMDEPVTVQQRYAPRRSGRFHLIGPPIFGSGAEVENLTDAEADARLNALHSGIRRHEDAADRWDGWARA